jgi:predicted dehydrogenase
VAVVGVHGHGSSHVRNVARLAAAGRVRFTAVADPRPLDDLPDGVAAYADLPGLLASTEVDVVIICTPIQTHAPLAEAALRAGADVLLEKPPAPSLAEFEHLSAVLAETGRTCQIGFQAHGSQAARALAAMVADGKLGDIRGIGVAGTWVRTQAYWQRARWAGRRSLDGVPVVDGAITNPFAHAVATALLVDGSNTADQVHSVETELFRANPIEADDTSSVRVTTTRGTSVVSAFTLCAEQTAPPRIIVHGSTGQAVLWYVSDQLEISYDGEVVRTEHGRDDLLENLLDHRVDPAVRLLAPLSATGAFTRVLDAVRTSPEPREIAPGLLHWEGDGPDRRPVVHEVEKWIEQSAQQLALFSELPAPWTR